jgi:hypothetical protein
VRARVPATQKVSSEPVSQAAKLPPYVPAKPGETVVTDDFDVFQEGYASTPYDGSVDNVKAEAKKTPYVVDRPDPWIITCESWLARGRYIALPINPEQISFSLPLRVAHDDGYACKYIYIWRRRRSKSMTGSMQISFTVSSSNIIPQFDISTAEKESLAATYTGLTPFTEEQAADHTRGVSDYTLASVKGLYDKAVPLGVSNLYAMLALANVPRVRNDGTKTEDRLGIGKTKSIQQTTNHVVMCISTLVFPRLLLYGQFTPDGIQVSMSADNPAEFTMTFSLLVNKTNPTMGHDSWRSLVDSYKQNMYSGGRSVDWMMSTYGYSGAKPEAPQTGPTETYQETIDRPKEMTDEENRDIVQETDDLGIPA